MQSVSSPAVATVIASAAATGALALLPQLHLGYSWHAQDLALEPTASVIALLACFLIFARLRRGTPPSALMLACALAVAALSNLFLVTLRIVAGWTLDGLTLWGAPAACSGWITRLEQLQRASWLVAQVPAGADEEHH